MKSIESPNLYANHVAKAWPKFEELSTNEKATLVDVYRLIYGAVYGTPAFNKPKTNKLLNELVVKMRNAADPNYKRKRTTVVGYVNKLKRIIDFCSRTELNMIGGYGWMSVPLNKISEEELNELERKLKV